MSSKITVQVFAGIGWLLFVTGFLTYLSYMFSNGVGFILWTTLILLLLFIINISALAYSLILNAICRDLLSKDIKQSRQRYNRALLISIAIMTVSLLAAILLKYSSSLWLLIWIKYLSVTTALVSFLALTVFLINRSKLIGGPSDSN